MGFLTDIEAARALAVPVSILRTMEVHRCPQGYHIDTIKSFCASNGLPVGDWYNVLAIKTEAAPTNHEGVEWFDNLTSLLWRVDPFTKAIILPTESPDLWEFIKEKSSTKLIVIGDSECCHLSINSWIKAIDIACQKI